MAGDCWGTCKPLPAGMRVRLLVPEVRERGNMAAKHECQQGHANA